HLSSKLNINSYAKKLSDKATFVIALKEKEIIGMIAVYDNDYKHFNAYLPIIGTKSNYRGKGIGRKLLDCLFTHLLDRNFQKLSLETWYGSPAQTFYLRNNFIIDSIVNDRPGNIKSVRMVRWLGNIQSPMEVCKTSLEYNVEISNDLGVNLFIKRDDYYPKFGGGNKARKLDYILKSAVDNGHNAVV